MITKDEVLKLRLQAWIFNGVEIELEMAEAYISKRLDRGEEDEYWDRQIKKCQGKLETINKRIIDLEAQVAA